MTNRELTPPARATQPAPLRIPRWLLQPRNLVLIGAAAIGAGLALNWSWLTAAGAAPILLGVLPCLGMCALGLCMRGKPAGTGAAADAASVEPAAPDSWVPTSPPSLQQ
jgi:hypothetical protein